MRKFNRDVEDVESVLVGRDDLGTPQAERWCDNYGTPRSLCPTVHHYCIAIYLSFVTA
ncbi:MAG: hypothetical protein GXZ14_11530 [Ruminococcaceae bacterium]|nr:hypothetical protein [Oscillospiraceae bacterium]